MNAKEAFEFERNNRLHETRKTAGILNRLTPLQWRIHHDDKTNVRTIESIDPLIKGLARPVVLAIGVGGGRMFKLFWNQPNVVRVGLDINHDVLATEGKHHFQAVEGSAYHLPVRDDSVDIVLFDYVLHHLVGQDEMENSIKEAFRVLRSGGYIVAREPSSFSPSGLAMNIANKFQLMNAIAGASNYEFAISPPYLLKLFKREGSVVDVQGLSYLWSRRLPIGLQEMIGRLEPYLFKHQRSRWLADFMLYIIRKN
jgi:ubiquinone/menaquinone biosynthesis C-methylase UbiE